jgi:branched-chain amino acid transport system substrate-binding protein
MLVRAAGRDYSFSGRLPAAKEVYERFQDLQDSHEQLGQPTLINLPTVQVTNVNSHDHYWEVEASFGESFNHWLMQRSVVKELILPLSQVLPQARGLKFFIQTNDPLLQRLPWPMWDLFDETYPDAEVILASDFRPSAAKLRWPVKLLAVEGDVSNTQAYLDVAQLHAIPGLDITVLRQPSQAELRDQLWYEAYDMLLFIGHSRSSDRTGEIALNESETLSMDDLHEVLKYSASNGLKLAIFNSCDGVGIAANLADLKIPCTIVMRQRVPDVMAQLFLRTFLTTFAKGKPLHQSVMAARRKLKENQRQFPGSPWLPVIYQNPSAPELKYPRESFLFQLWNRCQRSLLIKRIPYMCLALIVAAFLFFFQRNESQVYAQHTSLGQQLLTETARSHQTRLNPALQAFQNQQYNRAAQLFEQFQQTGESPEIMIYGNNARLRSRHVDALRIAASVPIGGTNPGIAEEMLRGIALAQKELIDQMPIEVMIVADANNRPKNDPSMVDRLIQLLAPRIVDDKKVIAVIGPNATDAAKEAAQIYTGKLLMITPTAFWDGQQDAGNYTYRMLPPTREMAKEIATQIQGRFEIDKKIAICAHSFSPDNEALADAFRREFAAHRIKNINCDRASDYLKVAQEKDFQQEVGAVLLAPHIEHMDEGYAIIKAATQQGLKVLGSPTLYSDRTLNWAEKEQIEGFILYAPWSPFKAQEMNSNRPNKLSQAWKKNLTWRTATSYDAFQLVATGIRDHYVTRSGIRDFMKLYEINVYQGQTGLIQFRKGDRADNLLYDDLLEVRKNKEGKMVYTPLKKML